MNKHANSNANLAPNAPMPMKIFGSLMAVGYAAEREGACRAWNAPNFH